MYNTNNNTNDNLNKKMSPNTPITFNTNFHNQTETQMLTTMQK